MQPAPRRFPAAFAAGLCLLAAGSLAAPLSGPILDLGFDSFHGTTTPDASGRGNDGLVIAGLQVKGVRGTALDFSLPNASVMCDATGSLELPGPLSLEAWVCTKGTATGSFGTVIRKEEAYALRFNGSQIGLLLWMNGKVHYLHSPPLDIRPGAWMHLAGTFDGQAMRLYVDGREVPSSPQPLEGTVDRSGAPCCIGSCRGGNAFQGLVDEARVYARALAPAEISDAHAAGLEALAREQAVVVEPREIGERPQPFRKPPREIRAVVPGFLWVDAEDFAEYGGWVLDTQFVHLMGSAYLLAAGVGTPVSDAGTRLDLPEAGRYRVWVRTRNWSPPHAPGQFLVRVDDRPLPRVFGKVNSGAWTWESGGECDLAAGTHSLALRDMTGYYGRCDAMLLTTDLQYVPPEGSEDVCRERARLCGFSLDPEPAGDFDVIVVGAGSAGFPAALASARLGSRTALIQNRPVLGGNASRECGVPLNGAASGHPNARETGIAEEVGRVRARHGYRSYSEPFRLLADEEPRLEVFTNRHVFAVTMASPTRIASVRAVDTLTGRVSEYTARQFVDCTGDGWVGYFAKAEFRLGRESRDEFDEDLAPAEADSQTMSGCLMGNGLGFRAADSGAPAPFVRPPWAREILELEGPGRKLRHISGGEWWLEHPNTIDDIWQAEEARDELIKIAFSYWDWIRSRSRMREQAANYALQHIPIMDAKRESRRLVGDYILNQRDCQEGRVFPDRIAYGGWPLDVHHAEGIFSGAGGSFHCNARVPIYTIPYRCLYSRNLENLLFAGRCASVSHIALGSIRVQSTLATLGQAAGTAAALCNALGTTPRGIYRDHIGVLQQLLLKNDQTIPGIRNEDSADLARTATATASSTAAVVLFSAADVEREAGHPLDHDRGMVFPAAGMGRLRSLSLRLGNEREEEVPVTLHVRAAAEADDLSATTDLASVTAVVPAGREGWVTFEVDVPVSSPYLWFWLPQTEGVRWRLMTAAPEGCNRFYGHAGTGNWTIRKGERYAFRPQPPLAVPAEFAPEYAINGMARMWDGQTNMWASDPLQPMPQWLELRFPKAVELNTVYLTFDTNLAPRLHGPGKPPECVREYSVSIRQGNGWQEVGRVSNNFQRRNTVRFPTARADALRVTVTATNGDPSARIFEIRTYRE